jgi:hypothetical protein
MCMTEHAPPRLALPTWQRPGEQTSFDSRYTGRCVYLSCGFSVRDPGSLRGGPFAVPSARIRSMHIRSVRVGKRHRVLKRFRAMRLRPTHTACKDGPPSNIAFMIHTLVDFDAVRDGNAKWGAVPSRVRQHHDQQPGRLTAICSPRTIFLAVVVRFCLI